ncbi:MAG: glycosyltransferase family 2 protein [Synechococcus lacustris]
MGKKLQAGIKKFKSTLLARLLYLLSSAGIEQGLQQFLRERLGETAVDPNNPIQLRRAVAERLIPKLERLRGQIWADACRQWLIANQPGLKTKQRLSQTVKPQGLKPQKNNETTLLWPPGWDYNQKRRTRALNQLIARKKITGAKVVSCDDWIEQRPGQWSWRQKGRLDPLLDGALAEHEGPLLIDNTLLNKLGQPPTEPQQRAQWRSRLSDAISPEEWAHVPLPLVRAISTPARPNSHKPQGEPLVSILIPTGGFKKTINGNDEVMVRHCLNTLLKRSGYRNLEIVLVDGGELSDSLIEELKAQTSAQLGPDRWQLLRDPRPYSYSLRINQAAATARGEWLLQLNDDTELINPNSIETMLAVAQQANGGIVGALLLYPNGLVQHAGVAIDRLAPHHIWCGCNPKRLPVGFTQSARQFSAVTAAVSLCSKQLWQELGGLSEDLPINYGDVDFCLRAGRIGRKILLDPQSKWFHFESASRNTDGIPPELETFRRHWGPLLGNNNIDPHTSRWREVLTPRR